MGLYLRNRWLLLGETQSQRKSNDAFFTGLGYWTRANPEQCLLATRGSPRRRAYDVKRLVVEPPPPAQPKTRLHPNPHRALARRPPSRIVRPLNQARLGRLRLPKSVLFDNGHAPTAVNPRKPRRAHAA